MTEPNNLLNLIRNISLARLANQVDLKDMIVREFSERPKVYAHWMAIILISGPSMKITFKTHFKSQVARAMAARIYRKTPDEVSLGQATDFMRELCNMVGGAIRASLLAQQISIDLSLPILTRGFDEIFFAGSLGPNHIFDHWILHSSLGDLVCTATAEFFEKVDVSRIDSEFKPNVGGESDVEFF